jgi:hypothetical protein
MHMMTLPAYAYDDAPVLARQLHAERSRVRRPLVLVTTLLDVRTDQAP